jgi:UDP-N-acetylglucosamine 2-epimerase (non-hydrolysing)
VAAGTVRLGGTDTGRIASETHRLLTDAGARSAMARAINPYGDGRAAERTVSAIEHFFGLGPRPAEFGVPVPAAVPVRRRMAARVLVG